MATGGSIESVNIDGREMAVASDADSQRKLGGYENEVSPNGNGTARLIKTAVAWAVADLQVEIDDQNEDHEFLQALADGNDFFPCTITHADGAIYQGTGQITGEVQRSSTNATASVSLSGTGKLTKQ